MGPGSLPGPTILAPPDTATMPLTPALSAYLDFLRFTAALAVLLGHLTEDGFALGWIPLSHLSHEAVVVFFLMSGYIITVSTQARASAGATEYVVARVSRIYSVALPAVVFSVLMSLAVEAWTPDLTGEIASWRPFSWADVTASLLFWSESWSSDAGLTLNGPYWSLCYEVWYYLLFGLFFFVQGRWRWPLLLGAAALAGPAIMVLLPIWALGAWLALNPERLPKPSAVAAWVVWLLVPLLIWWLRTSEIDHAVKNWLHDRVPGFWRLEASQRLFTDYLIGLLLAGHLWAWAGLPERVQSLWQRSAAFWAALAGFSFTLYLFHRPMTTFAAKLAGNAANDVLLSLLAAAASLLACWLLAFGTERQLPRWRRLVRRLVARFAPPPAGGLPQPRA